MHPLRPPIRYHLGLLPEGGVFIRIGQFGGTLLNVEKGQTAGLSSSEVLFTTFKHLYLTPDMCPIVCVVSDI